MSVADGRRANRFPMSLVLAVLGAAIFIGGAYLTLPAYRLLHSGLAAQGEIISIDPSPGADDADADAPQAAGIETLPPALGLAIGGFGAIWFVAGTAMYWAAWRRDSLIGWLQNHGRRIPTTFSGVHEAARLSSDEPSRYYLESQWTDPASGKRYVFRSPEFFYIPDSALQSRKPIEVLIDPRNPRRYCMDTGFLR